MASWCQSASACGYQRLLNVVGLKTGGKAHEVGGADGIGPLRGPDIKDQQRKIVGRKDRPDKLQGPGSSVAESDQDQGRSNLRKHSEVEEFQSPEEPQRETLDSPVGEFRNRVAVKEPVVDGGEGWVRCKVVASRNDRAVVGEHHQKPEKEIRGREENRGRGVAPSLPSLPVTEFEQRHCIHAEHPCLAPTGDPNEYGKVQKHKNDAKWALPVARQKRI